MKKLFLLCLLLTACNKKIQNIEPEFQTDYDAFIYEAGQRGRVVYNTDNLEIKRGPFHDDAHCELEIEAGFAKATVTVNSHLQFFHDEHRRAVIFHELGHCLLYKRHNSALGPDGVAISLMHPFIPGQAFLKDRWAHYVDELMSYNP